MKWFSFSRRNLVHYGALHMAQWYLDNPGPRVEQDLATSGMSRADLHGKKLIVDFRAEGHFTTPSRNFVESKTITSTPLPVQIRYIDSFT